MTVPTEILYGIISFLGLSVLTLGGLWVRSHDEHRRWSSERIHEQNGRLAVVENTHRVIQADVSEIKEVLKDHMEIEIKFQAALATKLNLNLD